LILIDIKNEKINVLFLEYEKPYKTIMMYIYAFKIK